MLRRIALELSPAIALGTAVLTPAVAAAKQPERVEFNSADRDRTPLVGYLYRPAGRGPFPAVIALHGCGGLFSSVDRDRMSERNDDWADRLVRQGYVVLFPDSFGPRGIDTICKVRGKDRVTTGRRARDAEGAAAWLARQPFVDPDRLALLGWSHGATAVLSAARRNFELKRGKLRAGVAFYPACRPFADSSAWEPKIPLTILIGSVDDWTPPEPCRELARRFPNQIQLIEYPYAFHGFDAPDQRVHKLRGLAYTAGNTGTAHTGTEPEARRDAIKAVKLKLDQVFRLK